MTEKQIHQATGQRGNISQMLFKDRILTGRVPFEIPPDFDPGSLTEIIIHFGDGFIQEELKELNGAQNMEKIRKFLEALFPKNEKIDLRQMAGTSKDTPVIPSGAFFMIRAPEDFLNLIDGRDDDSQTSNAQKEKPFEQIALEAELGAKNSHVQLLLDELKRFSSQNAELKTQLEISQNQTGTLADQTIALRNRLIEMAESEKIASGALHKARKEIWELNAVNGTNNCVRRFLAKDAISNPFATIRNCRLAFGMPMHTPGETGALDQMFDGGSELPTDLKFLQRCHYLALDIISQAKKILAGHDDIKQPSWTVKQLQNLFESYFAPEKKGAADTAIDAGTEELRGETILKTKEDEFDGGGEKIDKTNANKEFDTSRHAGITIKPDEDSTNQA
ncbi:MAG: hypothetical protein NTY33_00340 [Candidatus Moranbacteria bacterium]|nr:hypothetical protein [Candidatus Moranbacteria bacterium]